MSERISDETISEWRRRRRSGESVREIAEDVGEPIHYVSGAVYGGNRFHGPKEPPVDLNGKDSHLADKINAGTDNSNAKMTEDMVAAMRRDYRDGGVTYDELAERYDVDASRQAIAAAVKGKTWAHVDAEPVT